MTENTIHRRLNLSIPREQTGTSDNCGCVVDRDESCCVGARDEGWTGAKAAGCAQSEVDWAGSGTMVLV